VPLAASADVKTGTTSSAVAQIVIAESRIANWLMSFS
jgi:hypothetical protein